MPDVPRRIAPLAVAGLLAVVTLAAAAPDVRLTRAPAPKLSAQPTTSPTPAATASAEAAQGAAQGGGQHAGLPGWVAVTVLVAALLLVAALVAGVVWWLIRDSVRVRLRTLPPASRGAATPAPRPAGDDVHAAVQAGIDALDDGAAAPRRAVIACWLRLEAGAAAAGTPRGPGDTPADLVHRMLATQRVDGAVLDRFAALYREARYAPHVVDETMRAEARASLHRLAGARRGAATVAS